MRTIFRAASALLCRQAALWGPSISWLTSLPDGEVSCFPPGASRKKAVTSYTLVPSRQQDSLVQWQATSLSVKNRGRGRSDSGDEASAFSRKLNKGGAETSSEGRLT
ncbi:uncharacterized protein AKAME5_002639900 [Lates japonicus]|uniref:Secreted protein n=1 Tax=Lates japonicus TaxID=270547 RepID=A0AAD3NQ07_LATJO|nr:uncharacterized protein AKAME5_002639900 [Lates japonicus]